MKTARIEMRAEPAVEKRLQRAADLSRASLSSFILRAAEEKADRVIAEHKETIVPATFFDEFYAALDGPAKGNKSLVKAAAKPRRVVQH